jgi:uncharacterized protein YacL
VSLGLILLKNNFNLEKVSELLELSVLELNELKDFQKQQNSF